MNWKILVDQRAEKILRRFPKKDLERIKKAIDEMELNPFFGDIEKLGGKENAWRRRVGNYRIFYELSLMEKIVLVYEIKRRTSSTY